MQVKILLLLCAILAAVWWLQRPQPSPVPPPPTAAAPAPEVQVEDYGVITQSPPPAKPVPAEQKQTGPAGSNTGGPILVQ